MFNYVKNDLDVKSCKFAKPNIFVAEHFQKNKSSFDALDGLLRLDRPKVVGAVLNNSF